MLTAVAFRGPTRPEVATGHIISWVRDDGVVFYVTSMQEELLFISGGALVISLCMLIAADIRVWLREKSTRSH